MSRILLIAAIGLALAACTPPAQHAAPAPEAITPAATEAPSGAYQIDPSHTSVLFRVNHLGFSSFTTNFTGITAALSLDTADPTRSTVEATIDVRSLALDNAPPGFFDIVMGAQLFDAARYPEIIFRSTSVEMTGANTARVHGDLTLHGLTRPIVLETTFNGGYAGHVQEPMARLGMSARASLKRSDYGMGLGVPPPGSTMGVGDDVEIVIESEFTGPAWPSPQPAATP